MAHDDPFTLDLFGGTALSSGLGLGVTAFGPDPGGHGDHDDDPPPSTPAPAGPAVALSQPSRADSRKRGDNFYLAGARGLPSGSV
ncbi:class I SAM-dependent methyltransferase, partial [Bradyrhizobium sp. SSUT112]|nr:class I SAM-dependent methyltransferase [Bradyrhizobium sp. SSUT112]